MSARWQASIGGLVRWHTRVQWSPNGRTWTDLQPVECSVTENAGQQVRWSLSATVRGADGLDTDGSLVRVLVTHTGTGETLQKGLYRVESVSRSLYSDRVQVSGVSLEQALIDGRLTKPTRYRAATARERLAGLIGGVLPGAAVTFDRGTDPDRPLPQQLVDRDRWEAVSGGPDAKSVAKALGAVVYADHEGRFRVSPLSAQSLTSTPTRQLRSGPGGVLLDASRQTDRESVRNVVVVKGASTEQGAKVVGPVVVIDDDRDSRTYARSNPLLGGFGPVPLFYTSPLITTVAQAEKTARSLLAPRLGMRQQIAFEQLYDPSVEAGEVHQLEGGTSLKAVLDSVTFDLIKRTMTGQCRASSSDEAGRVTTLTGSEDIDVPSA